MRIGISLIALALLATGMAGAQNASEPSKSERKIVSRATPAYPELAQKMHIQGTVRVEAIVRPNGSVKSSRVLGGNPVLVDAALEAVSKWKFETAQSETTEIVQLTFKDQP